MLVLGLPLLEVGPAGDACHGQRTVEVSERSACRPRTYPGSSPARDDMHRAAALLASTTVLGICGDDYSVPGNTFDPAACPEAVQVSSAADLMAVLAEERWGRDSPPTADLVISGKVVLDAADVPLPAECLERDDCRHTAVFSASKAPLGVRVEGDADESRLVLNDTIVRLATSLTFPGFSIEGVPVVSVIGRCGEPCDEGAFACAWNLLCYASYESYCRRCEGGAADVCACRSENGPKPDGEPCSFAVSVCAEAHGICRSGRCERME